ncbi:4'-phosphopantetheinyl transferase superfamily protein [Dysgonomonas sp. Marseille-P4677]|uniref:4'-phosphopantetheinyl transferase family protein n=1 Tax=Dysgonomonas sp. Marseille-P4677 TaxID=2364790 RepID=UPI0019132E1E|nr:4'-phosphopantetheinyl transferase superfamily protein [Dysgonomonas sp. Marseille-P4677]MBK5720718.1 4'-phosphopantetheinyl transferase superfamily protein [Dysgonomonas sp. Marseille-P4677]
MLYIKKNITPSTLIGIWQIEESREALLSGLSNHEWIENIHTIKSESRVLEILAARLLIKELVGEERQVYYTTSGKPHLTDQSHYISVSHTKKFVAVAINKLKPVGLDIEQISEKIRRVQSRVIGADEYIDPNNELIHLLLHWSAKEAMFKFLDSDSIDFRKHLFVENFVPKKEGQFFTSESRTESRHQFEAYYNVDKDFVMVCLEEQN